MLHLPIARLFLAVGEYDTIEHKLAVIGLIAKVTAVCKNHLAVLVLFPKALIHPIPNRRAENHIGRFNCVLIVLQVAHCVAHIVRIFGNVERFLGLVMRSFPLHPVYARILVGIHIHNGIVALVLQGARLIDCTNRICGSLEVLARACLIAKTPHRNARMVAVAPDHVNIARHRCLLPSLDVRKRVLAIVIAMRLYVCLVHYINAVNIAEIVEVIILRVVGIADMIDVRLLHETNIFKLPFARHPVAIHGIGLVAVNAAKLDLLAIKIVAAITNFRYKEADNGGNVFSDLALGRSSQDELVAVRLLGAPKLGRRDAKGICALLCRRHLYAVKVVKLSRNFCSANGVCCNIENPIACEIRPIHRPRRSMEIADACLGTRKKPRGARNAGKTEHVLILKIRAVGITVDLKSHEVDALLDELRNVELRRIARVLGEAHIFAVDPKVKERINRIKLEKDFLVFPACGKCEVAAIRAYGISLKISGPILWRLAHHVGLVALKGIRLVYVERSAPSALAVGTVCLPRAWNFDGRPSGHVIPKPLKPYGTLGGIACPVELPCRIGIERQSSLGKFRQNTKSALKLIEA